MGGGGRGKGGGGWGGGVVGELSGPDDAVKLKSFDLCPNPICIAPPSLLQPSPHPAARLHNGKSKTSLWLQLPLCGNE